MNTHKNSPRETSLDRRTNARQMTAEIRNSWSPSERFVRILRAQIRQQWLFGR